MNSTEEYILRIKNCITTILDIKKALEPVYGELELLKDFKNLEDVTNQLDVTRISERDVEILENATNSLLKELEALFKSANIKPLYNRLIN